MEASELREAAGAYVAGELEEAERRDFERLLVSQADLQAEVAFWRSCRQELGRHGRPPARLPGPGLADVIRERLAAERRPLRADPWRWGGWAAAAACLALLLGQWRPGDAAWYDEQGNAVVPISNPSAVHDVAFDAEEQPEARAWLGLAGLRPTPLPADLRASTGKDYGLQVFRVEGPAAVAGIRPGDIVLNVAECPTFSRVCVRQAMAEAGADRSVPVRYWSMRSDQIREVTLDPSVIWE